MFERNLSFIYLDRENSIRRWSFVCVCTHYAYKNVNLL